MANPYLILWCDPTANKIYSGWQKNTQSLTPTLKQGDQIGVELHWVRTGQYAATMQEVVFPPSATIRLAVGRLDSSPLGGTFTISYGANETTALAYDITATELQAALNGLSSIVSEGGVTVSKNGNQFRIVWNDEGAFTTSMSANTDMLYPTSQSSVIESRSGSATVSRIVLFKVRQSAIAAQTSFSQIPSPSISVTSLFTSTWRVAVSPQPKDGVFSITVVKGPTSYTTISLPYNADSFTVASALNSLNVVSGKVFTVTKSGDSTWDITAPSAVDSMTATSGLIGFSAFYGVLDMNTAEVEEFLSGSSSGDATLEVEADVDGELQTLIQTKVKVLNDLIDTSSFTLVSMGEVMPVDSVVRYDTSQALTNAEQLTARQNINAVSLADVSASLDLTNMPTLNEKNAMQYSVLPSQANPFVTMSERNSFDQDLNTTDLVQFGNVTVSDGTDTVVVSATGITFPDSTIQTSAADPTVYLTKSGNLSGLTNVSTARTNLGLGTMAVETATNYLAKADNLLGLANAATARTNLGLGTMATEASASYYNSTASDLRYLIKTNNLSDIPSASTARTNLGLGTMAVETASNYLAKSGNLSGLASTSTARTNIGLGSTDNVEFSQVKTPTIVFAGDLSTQTIASAGAPTDTTKGFIQIFDSTYWSTTEVYVGTGVLFESTALNTPACYFGHSIGTDSGAAVKVSDDGTYWMEYRGDGIRFKNGSFMGSAVRPMKIGTYDEAPHDITSFEWTSYEVNSGGATNYAISQGMRKLVKNSATAGNSISYYIDNDFSENGLVVVPSGSYRFTWKFNSSTGTSAGSVSCTGGGWVFVSHATPSTTNYQIGGFRMSYDSVADSVTFQYYSGTTVGDVQQIIIPVSGASNPIVDVVYDTGYNHFKLYINGSWSDISSYPTPYIHYNAFKYVGIHALGPSSSVVISGMKYSRTDAATTLNQNVWS